MAEWKNIFDLGEWDIYIKFNGITVEPDPDTTYYFVKAADLNPSIGTVSVVNGEIVCVMEDPSTNGGESPAIVVMPKFAAPVAQFRVTCSGFDGLGWSSPVVAMWGGPVLWDAQFNDPMRFESADGFVTPRVSPSPLPSGEGIAAGNYRSGA